MSAVSRAARSLPGAGGRARHERQRPAGDGLGNVRRATGRDPARARRRRTRANAHGWTALHQTAYSDLSAMARCCWIPGARVDVQRAGLVAGRSWSCFFLGQLRDRRVVCDARRSVIRNLRTAAWNGRPAWGGRTGPPDGHLGPQARAARFRTAPQPVFPVTSDDPREVLDQALVVGGAQRPGPELSTCSIARGRSVDDVYCGTALAWAMVCGRTASIRRRAASVIVVVWTTFGCWITARTPPRSTWPRRTATSTPSAPCSTSARIGTLEDGLYEARPRAGPEHGASTRRASCLAGGPADRPRECPSPAVRHPRSALPTTSARRLLRGCERRPWRAG